MHLQSVANYQARLIRGRSETGFEVAVRMHQVKVDRIEHLNEARNRFEAKKKDLSFWTGKWTREIRKNLKQSGLLSISFWHVFLLRRLLVIVCILFLFHKPMYQSTLFMVISFVQLLYLCYARPYVSDLKNCMEIYNEFVIYMLSFCFIGSEIAQTLFTGD